MTSPAFIDRKEVAVRRDSQTERMKARFDPRATDIDVLSAGDTVAVQDRKTGRWDGRATITTIRDDERSYDLLFADGSISCRNRKYLKPIPP